MRIVRRIATEYNRRFHNKCILYVLHPERATAIQPNGSHQIEMASDVKEMTAKCDVPEYLIDDFDRRFRQGHKCCFCVEGTSLIAYGWISNITNRMYLYELAATVSLRTKVFWLYDFWLYDFWVAEQFRRRGIYSEMLCKFISECCGCCKAVIYAERENEGSRRAIELVGFEQVGWVSHFKKKISF